MGFMGSQAWVCYGIGGFWGSRGFRVVPDLETGLWNGPENGNDHLGRIGFTCA